MHLSSSPRGSQEFLPDIGLRKSGLSSSSESILRKSVKFNDQFDGENLRTSGSFSSSPERRRRPFSAYPNPREFVDQMQSQISAYRDELQRKDHLLTRLQRFNGFEKHFDNNFSQQNFFKKSNENGIIQDYAAVQVKLDGLRNQLNETQSELDIKNARLSEAEKDCLLYRESEARQNALVNSLTEKLAKLEQQTLFSGDTLVGSEFTITALQEENRDAKERIAELESRIRTQLTEREDAEQKKLSAERKLFDFLLELRDFIGATELDQPEHVVSKIKELVNENSVLHGEMLNLRQTVESTEADARSNRETIRRLFDDKSREEQHSARYLNEVDAVKKDLDESEFARKELQREVNLLKEKLRDSQRAWTYTKHELDKHEGQLTDLDRSARENMFRLQENRAFRDQLASLMSDRFHIVDPKEQNIIGRLTEILRELDHSKTEASQYDHRVATLTRQLESQSEYQRSVERSFDVTKMERDELDQSLRKLALDQSAKDILRDGVSLDRERYQRCLERIALSMKLPHMSPRLGSSQISCDLLCRRADELVACEERMLDINSDERYRRLHDKMEQLREQLLNKEQHAELLRKKLSDQEESVELLKSDQSDKDSKQVSRMKRERDKYRNELGDARSELKKLKAKMMDTKNLKMATAEQQDEIDILINELQELESVRDRQARKIANLRDEVAQTQHTQSFDDPTTIQRLTEELRKVRDQLNSAVARESQLREFRSTVVRILGHDSGGLMVPDADVFRRLEQMVMSSVREQSLNDMDKNFKRGYKEAKFKVKKKRKDHSPLRFDPKSY